MNDPKPTSDNIWITTKARMQAERRYKTYGTISHVSLTLLSLYLIFLNVFSTQLQSHISSFEEVTLATSIFVFALSLVVFGFKFEQMAWTHRDCYLKLQALQRRDLSEHDRQLQYLETISAYPNHWSIDYDDFIIDQVLIRNKKLSINGQPIKLTVPIFVNRIIRYGLWILLLSALFSPLAFLSRTCGVFG